MQTSLALKTLTVLLCLLEAAGATSDHLNLNKPGTAVLSALAQALREEIRVSEGMGIVGDEELKAAAPMGGMSGVEGDSGGKLVLADLQWRLARARRLLVLGQVSGETGSDHSMHTHQILFTIHSRLLFTLDY